MAPHSETELGAGSMLDEEAAPVSAQSMMPACRPTTSWVVAEMLRADAPDWSAVVQGVERCASEQVLLGTPHSKVGFSEPLESASPLPHSVGDLSPLSLSHMSAARDELEVLSAGISGILAESLDASPCKASPC